MSALAHAEESRVARPRLAVAPDPAQVVIVVRFVAPDGREWPAIGGGETLAEALRFARESCPDGVMWKPLRWEQLYEA